MLPSFSNSTRSADLARLLLCGGLLLSSSVELVWSRDADRERGGYGSYDDPVGWPTLPTPGQQVAATAISPPPDQSAESAEVQGAQTEQMVGCAVVDADGEALGAVRAVVRSKHDHKLQAVVAIAGFLGLDKKHVVVPMDQLSLQTSSSGVRSLLAAGIDHDELGQMVEYLPEQFDLVSPAPVQAKSG